MNTGVFEQAFNGSCPTCGQTYHPPAPARRFTLTEFTADVYSPHQGDREATRAMLVRLGVPFDDV